MFVIVAHLCQEVGLIKLSLLFSAFFMPVQAANAGQGTPPSTPPQYSMNIDSQEALRWHPLEKSFDRGLIVTVLINGKPVKAGIDTGNTMPNGLLLTSQAAKRLGVIVTTTTSRTLTYAGPQDAGAGVANSVLIGGVSFSNAPVSVKSSLGYDSDVEAVVGIELLKYVTLVVEPSNRRVRFLLPGELANIQKRGDLIALTQGSGGLISIETVKICGADMNLVADTGDNSDVVLKSAVLQRLGCNSSVKSDTRAETSAGPVIRRRIGIANAGIGPVALGPILAGEVSNDVAAGLGLDGTIGLGVLGRFDFAFDVSSRRLLIMGYSSGAAIERPTIGLQFKKLPDALEVTHVEANSPASKSPLAAGDKICFIDGKSVRELGDRFDTNPVPGTELRLKTCDGRAIAITAVDFFFPNGVPHPTRASLPNTPVGAFTAAVVACIYGDVAGRNASCTAVIDAPAETRSVGDFRIPALLFRAMGKDSMGDVSGAREDYRHVLELDPNNAQAAAALKGAKS